MRLKGEPIVPPRGRGGGHGGGSVAVKVLAEEPSRITGVLQVPGDVLIFIAVPVVTFPATVADVGVWVEGVGVEPYLGVVGVLTAHGGGPRGATKGVTHEGVLEAPAFGYQLRGGLRHVSGVEVVFAHVVGKDEDYVGLWSCRLREATLLIAGSHTQANEQAYQRDQHEVFISPSHDFLYLLRAVEAPLLPAHHTRSVSPSHAAFAVTAFLDVYLLPWGLHCYL